MKPNIAIIKASAGKSELNSKLSLALHRICGKTILDYQVEKLRSEKFAQVIVAVYQNDKDLIEYCDIQEIPMIVYVDDESLSNDLILNSGNITKDENVIFYNLLFPLNSMEDFDIKTRIDLAKCEKETRKQINEKLMLSGVGFINPEDAYIDHSVIIGRDTIIYPGAIISGETIIGEDCVIGQNSRIEDSIIGDKVEIISSVVIKSKVDEGTKIGPFAYLRPNSNIGKHVKIGDFVEVKNSIIGDNSKVSHLAYVGDADVGAGVNIGCGVVFVNYDGKNKFRSIIKDGAFIGSNSNVVAPVEIAERAYIAAGTTVCRDVPSGTLCLGRVKEKHIEGWVDRKKLLK